MMKRTKLFLAILALFSASIFTTGCSKDNYQDVDSQNPTLDLTLSHIQSEIGRTFTIKGKVADKDGIKSIQLICDALDLNKTIDILNIYDKRVEEYELSYDFKTPKTQEGDNFKIKVLVTDLGDRVVEQEILVTMDGDFTPPVFTASPSSKITVLVKTNTKLNLRFSVQDDKALDYVKVEIPELNISEQKSVDGKVYNFNEELSLPSELKTYNLTVTAVDKFAMETVKTSVITVSEMPDFPKMYLSDVNTVEELNSDLLGIPMLVDHTGEFSYTARYYCEKAGTEVRFIPQKSDFTPICFGVNPNDTNLFTDEPEVSKPIVLNEKGYYEITFNVKSGAYTVNKYTPTDEPLPQGKPYKLNPSEDYTTTFQLSLAGAGLPGVDDWSTSNPFVLTLDPENPYRFYGDMNLEAGTTVEFTITPRHDWGWWPEPYFRFENGEDSGENEYNTKNAGNNMTKVTTTKDGKYRFVFDSHLMRSKFYPIN